MKYLSFSLWGDNPMYNVGAIKNAELSKVLYYDWKMVVYHDNTVPNETLSKLKDLDITLINVTDLNLYGMFWRFLSVDLPDSEYSIFRDCDSRITMRERLAVDEWIKSGKSLHVMRDHPYHRVPFGATGLGILGGMWGIKSKSLPLKDMIIKFTHKKELGYGSDQTFLQEVYKLLEKDKITHDEFFENKPFPIAREDGRFIGDRIDVNDQPVGSDYKLVIK